MPVKPVNAPRSHGHPFLHVPKCLLQTCLRGSLVPAADKVGVDKFVWKSRGAVDNILLSGIVSRTETHKATSKHFSLDGCPRKSLVLVRVGGLSNWQESCAHTL